MRSARTAAAHMAPPATAVATTPVLNPALLGLLQQPNNYLALGISTTPVAPLTFTDAPEGMLHCNNVCNFFWDDLTLFDTQI